MYTMAQTEPLMKSDPDWFDFTFESIWEEVRKKRDNQFSYSNGSDAYDRCSHRGAEVTQDVFHPSRR